MARKTYPMGGNAALHLLCADDNGDGTLTPVVSLGCSMNKTPVGTTNTLASTAATADQVVVTYTVTAGKTFFLQFADVAARLTTYAATATNFGVASLQIDGAVVWTQMLMGAGNSPQVFMEPGGEPIAVPGGKVIRIVCTPSAATAFTWRGNIVGYEK